MHESSRQQLIHAMRAHRELLPVPQVVTALEQRDTAVLSQLITLSESTLDVHRKYTEDVLKAVLPRTGQSIRLGITGVPGVGKSTLIEQLGKHWMEQGHRVAVLAIDPSSPVSGGSILGDKTRMEALSAHPNAFVRPSPSSQSLGGVAARTHEAILLCEAAGFDRIVVETVGVGQSEVAVHGITDIFLLLMLAGAGDQLQGIKRGIMEMCDLMAITKADGENEKMAYHAQAEYRSALHLFPAREDAWTPEVLTVSSLNNKGITELASSIDSYYQWISQRQLAAQRQAQLREQMKQEWHIQWERKQAADPVFAGKWNKALDELERGTISVSEAIRKLLD